MRAEKAVKHESDSDTLVSLEWSSKASEKDWGN